MKKMLLFITSIAMVLGGLYTATQTYLDKKLNIQDETLIQVQKGASLTSVAAQLATNKIIVYPEIFVKIGQYYGYGRSIKYGEYLLLPDQTYRQALTKLSSGVAHAYKVTFFEGEHMYHYARVLDKAGLCQSEEFLKWVRDPAFANKLTGADVAHLEGYLFPETYTFSKIDGCKKIISTMVNRFKKAFAPLVKRVKNLSPHQVVTLASIIEKETGAAFERPVISSVFHNRLKKGMRLQTDPTIIYGIMHETGKEIQNIRKQDLSRPTAYNTYVIKGLPPGPIGNPGLEALRAAIAPKQTPYLYFVSRNNGTHVFSKTYQEHLRAVRKFQLNRKMRQGKSWRNLKKAKGRSQ